MTESSTHTNTLPASSFHSLPDLWHHRVTSTPNATALRFMKKGEWSTVTWKDTNTHVKNIANGLLSIGFTPNQRCCILSNTRPEWIWADMAVLGAGGVTTTIHPSSTAEDCLYILTHSESSVIFCDTLEQWTKLASIRHRIPHSICIVVFDGLPTLHTKDFNLSAWEALGSGFEECHPNALDHIREVIQPTDLATIMYTSGTTGIPKGVMLTHDNWLYQGEAIDALDILSPSDQHFLFLPLSHVFAKVLQIAFIRIGIPTTMNDSPSTLLADIAEHSPTFMAVVPQFLEGIYNEVLRTVSSQNRPKQQLFSWAIATGVEVAKCQQNNQSISPILAWKHRIADKLVLKNIRARLGGGLRFLISGGAPLSVEIAEFYHGIGCLVLEGYGLTESSAASCVNRPERYNFGTVGPPLPGCEVKILEDGEICLRSRGVMEGYYKEPEATQSVLTSDGWLKTGDIGLSLESGHVKITGRKKEIIVTAGAKNIAPARFERLLRTHCPLISHVMMYGDTKPYCVALVALDEQAVSRWAQTHHKNIPHNRTWQDSEIIRREVESHIDQVNRMLPGYERVREFEIIGDDLTIANGALTPTHKLKRNIVTRRYAPQIEALYMSNSSDSNSVNHSAYG